MFGEMKFRVSLFCPTNLLSYVQSHMMPVFYLKKFGKFFISGPQILYAWQSETRGHVRRRKMGQ